MKKIIAIAVIGSMLGCAGTGSRFVPIVDGKGDQARYQSDLRECQAYADQLASAGNAAAAGAIVGAGIGLLFAVAGGGSRGYGLRNGMAGVGAVSGALGAAGKAETDQRSVISRCLMGRGYSVLN